jgi:Actinobacteria/chloroflexi VLRF1 release factor
VNAVLVPGERLVRWVANFDVRHGSAQLVVSGGGLHGVAADGSTFAARLPFDVSYAGSPAAADFAAAAVAPEDWGVLLVRKGGFAVARLHGPALVDSKTGKRHVQGKTKAGGQSQRRFARRRDNQARQAFEAAAGHAARVLNGLGPVVFGGDRTATDEVLKDPRLAAVVPVSRWLSVADPRRDVLTRAVLDAQAISLEVTNAA